MKKKEYPVSGKDSVEALLGYVPVLNVLFYFSNRRSRFVHYHALQSILLDVLAIVVAVVLALISGAAQPKSSYIGNYQVPTYSNAISLLGILQWVLLIVFLLVLLCCMLAAYHGKWLRLPLLGRLALKGSEPNAAAARRASVSNGSARYNAASGGYARRERGEYAMSSRRTVREEEALPYPVAADLSQPPTKENAQATVKDIPSGQRATRNVGYEDAATSRRTSQQRQRTNRRNEEE